MLNSYTLQKYNYKNQILSNSGPINKCYLLTMENSKRKDSYTLQLNKNPILSTINILTNKGYKNGGKPEWVNNSMKDIFHANLTIFDLEKENNGYVMVLEDDVEFTEDLRDNIKDVENFIKNNSPDVYFLGCNILLCNPTTNNHINMKLSGSAHCSIYSQKTRNKILSDGVEMYKNSNLPHDIFLSKNIYNTQYTFWKPLAVQKHPYTENMKIWDHTGIIRVLVKLLQTDKDPYIVYSISHTVGRIIGGWIMLITLLILLIICIIVILITKNKKSKKILIYK